MGIWSKLFGKNDKEIGIKVDRDDGSSVHLLNPYGKSQKYVKELSEDVDAFTGEVLAPNQKAFRAGYMKSQQDSRAVYNSKKAKELGMTNSEYNLKNSKSSYWAKRRTEKK